MEIIYLTKNNTMMNLVTRAKIIKIMTSIENDGLTKKQIADKCDISVSTLNNYLTSQTWADIRKLRLSVVSETLSKVDQAIFAKAINGDLSAAKLVYSRWDSQQQDIKDLEENDQTKTIEQIEDEIKQIKQQIKKYSS